MKIINVTVREKIAERNTDIEYVCGNSDYVVDFDFDEEWGGFEIKTARFVYGKSHTDVVFTGTQCAVPPLFDIYGFSVGVFAGDLHTTSPAFVRARRSILCGGGLPAAPSDDVYAQITALCNEAVSDAKSVREDADAGKFNGAPGKTPVVGEDYFTEADKQAIAAEAAEAVGFPQPAASDNGKILGCKNGAATWMPVEASGGGDGDKWETICEIVGFDEDLHMYEVNDANGPVYKKIHLTVSGGSTNTVFAFCGRGKGLPDIYSGTNGVISGFSIASLVKNPTAFSARIEKDDIGVYTQVTISSGVGSTGNATPIFEPIGYGIPDDGFNRYRNVYKLGGIQNIRIYQNDNSALPTSMRCRIMGVRA